MTIPSSSDRRYFRVQKEMEKLGSWVHRREAWNKGERRGAVVRYGDRKTSMYEVIRITHDGIIGAPVPFVNRADAEDYADAFVRGKAE